MSRLNLTLPEASMRSLSKHAKGQPAARFARELIEEGLARREQAERQRRLAQDYAAGRTDAREVLADFEPLALEIVGDERD
jgi:hypothetical protein